MWANNCKENIMKKILLIFVLSFTLSACGSGLDGKYSDENGMMEYRFESNGKVYLNSALGLGLAGFELEFEYEIDGEKLKITAPGKEGIIRMTLNEDGSINAAPGLKLTKKE
jgi:hypothetical protein